MQARLLVVPLLMGMLVAGCMDVGAPTTPTNNVPPVVMPPTQPDAVKDAAYAALRQVMADVPCDAPVSMSTSGNLKHLTNLSLPVETGHGTQEIDIRDQWVVMAAGISSRDQNESTLGFRLWNIADPAHPYQVGSFDGGRGKLDVKFGPDGLTVFEGAKAGIDVVDISDPTAPTLVSQWNFSSMPQFPGEVTAERNGHMLYTKEIGGQQWLFLAPNSNAGVWIFKITGEPSKRMLEYVTNTGAGGAAEGGALGPHDMYVQFDPDMKKWLLYSADGFHGWQVFDVDNPAKPTFVGGIIGPESGYTHTIQATKIGSKRIVATIQEVGVNVMEVYDATVLQAPVLIATWNIARTDPQGSPGGPTYPQHNFNIVDGKLFLAHYDSGMFVFDLTKVMTVPVGGTVSLTPIAHYEGKPGPQQPAGYGDIWDVVLKDGVLYTSSMSLGVDVLGFGCLDVGTTTFTSDG